MHDASGGSVQGAFRPKPVDIDWTLLSDDDETPARRRGTRGGSKARRKRRALASRAAEAQEGEARAAEAR